MSQGRPEDVAPAGRAARATDQSWIAGLVLVGLILAMSAVTAGLYFALGHNLAASYVVVGTVSVVFVAVDAARREFARYQGLGLPLLPNAVGWIVAVLAFPVVVVPCYLIERPDLPLRG